MTNLIDIKGVRHAYKTPSGPLPVLDGLELSVPEGGFAARRRPLGLRQVHTHATGRGP